MKDANIGPASEPFSQAMPLGSVTGTVTRYQIQYAASHHVPYEGANAQVMEDFPLGFPPSYGSALAFKGVAANGDLEFYGLTDRGPNGDGPNVPAPTGSANMGSKIFPSPSFVPAIGVITVGKNGASLTSSVPLKVRASVSASGLPVPPGSIGNSAEIPVFDTMKFDAGSKAVFNAGGIDTEGLAFDKKRNLLWAADEYGPFLVTIDPGSGLMLSKYAPGAGLPAIFAKRRANRGMEGLTLDTSTDKLHAFLQSPLADDSAFYALTGKNELVERFARFNRWVEFDPVAGAATRMFAYPLDGAEYKEGRTGNAKLGDMVALGEGKFIVIEQGAGASGEVFNHLMLLETAGASDIAAGAFNPDTSDLEKSSMSGAAVRGASWADVVPLKKTLLLDLNAIGWVAEKAEGLALVDGATLAISSDNDFGLLTRVFSAAGVAIHDVDVSSIDMTVAGGEAHSIRVARGEDKERPSRLWLISFDKDLSRYQAGR